MRRLLFLLTLLLALAVGGVNPAVARAQDDLEDIADNTAVVYNTEDDSSLFDFAFSIRDVAGEVVDETNAAIAISQCESCRSVAVAIQIVLVVGSPSVVTPENVALAVNFQCTLCESLAMAYQFVLGVPPDFHFSGEAMSEIKRIRNEIRRLLREDLPLAELRQRIRRLLREDLPLAELRQRIDVLADRLRQVIREDIRRHEERKNRGADDDEDEERRTPSPPPPAETSPTTTGETGTAPTETTETETTPTETTETATTATETTETTTVP